MKYEVRSTIFASFFLVFFFLIPTKVFAADVVINELMPHPSSGEDWIELYNISSQPISLANWKITDTTSVVETLTGSIEGGGFVVFEVTNRLNNGGDTLTLKDQSDATSDSYTYTSDPGADISIGRQPDGIGTWVVFSSSTKGSSNNSSTPAPTSTPNPTNTPTPTNVLTPTKTPTPTKISTPTKTPTPVKSPTLIEDKEDVLKPTLVKKSSDSGDRSVLSEEDKAEINLETTDVGKESPSSTATVAGAKSGGPNKTFLFFVGGGLLFIASGIMLLWKKKQINI